MLLSLRNDNMIMAIIDTENIISLNRLVVGSQKRLDSTYGEYDIVNSPNYILYLGAELISIPLKKNKRQLRLVYCNNKVCYIECFDVHYLKLCAV